MAHFLDQFILSAPLFSLVLVGFVAMRFFGWDKSVADALTQLVFNLALPASLFLLLANFSKLPPVDARLLLAFFGSCFIVFIIGRIIAARFLGLDGQSGSVVAMGGIFSNNLMLGLPLAKILIGERALPSAALVITFNALILWTLLTISIEWARFGRLSIKSLQGVLLTVIKNPLIIAVFSGFLYGLIGFPLPFIIESPLILMSSATAPLSLIALGMGLVEFGIKGHLKVSLTVTCLKLIVQPLVIFLLAYLLKLPKTETLVVVLLGGTACGANVYIMAKKFAKEEGAMASALVLSTIFAALSTPFILGLVQLYY